MSYLKCGLMIMRARCGFKSWYVVINLYSNYVKQMCNIHTPKRSIPFLATLLNGCDLRLIVRVNTNLSFEKGIYLLDRLQH